MVRLIRNPIAPYRWALVIVFTAMLIETAMSLAGPWPLKIVLDNVVGTHHLPGWLDGLVKHVAGGAGRMQIAAMAAIGFVLIAAISGLASRALGRNRPDKILAVAATPRILDPSIAGGMMGMTFRIYVISDKHEPARWRIPRRPRAGVEHRTVGVPVSTSTCWSSAA